MNRLYKNIARALLGLMVFVQPATMVGAALEPETFWVGHYGNPYQFGTNLITKSFMASKLNEQNNQQLKNAILAALPEADRPTFQNDITNNNPSITSQFLLIDAYGVQGDLNAVFHPWALAQPLVGWGASINLPMGFFNPIGITTIDMPLNTLTPLPVNPHDNAYSPDNAKFTFAPRYEIAFFWAVASYKPAGPGNEQKTIITAVLLSKNQAIHDFLTANHGHDFLQLYDFSLDGLKQYLTTEMRNISPLNFEGLQQIIQTINTLFTDQEQRQPILFNYGNNHPIDHRVRQGIQQNPPDVFGLSAFNLTPEQRQQVQQRLNNDEELQLTLIQAGENQELRQALILSLLQPQDGTTTPPTPTAQPAMPTTNQPATTHTQQNTVLIPDLINGQCRICFDENIPVVNLTGGDMCPECLAGIIMSNGQAGVNIYHPLTRNVIPLEIFAYYNIQPNQYGLTADGTLYEVDDSITDRNSERYIDPLVIEFGTNILLQREATTAELTSLADRLGSRYMHQAELEYLASCNDVRTMPDLGRRRTEEFQARVRQLNPSFTGTGPTPVQLARLQPIEEDDSDDDEEEIIFQPSNTPTNQRERLYFNLIAGQLKEIANDRNKQELVLDENNTAWKNITPEFQAVLRELQQRYQQEVIRRRSVPAALPTNTITIDYTFIDPTDSNEQAVKRFIEEQVIFESSPEWQQLTQASKDTLLDFKNAYNAESSLQRRRLLQTMLQRPTDTTEQAAFAVIVEKITNPQEMEDAPEWDNLTQEAQEAFRDALCNGCNDFFDNKNHAKIVIDSHGHTLCKECLTKLPITGDGGHHCPDCREVIAISVFNDNNIVPNQNRIRGETLINNQSAIDSQNATQAEATRNQRLFDQLQRDLSTPELINISIPNRQRLQEIAAIEWEGFIDRTLGNNAATFRTYQMLNTIQTILNNIGGHDNGDFWSQLRAYYTSPQAIIQDTTTVNNLETLKFRITQTINSHPTQIKIDNLSQIRVTENNSTLTEALTQFKNNLDPLINKHGFLKKLFNPFTRDATDTYRRERFCHAYNVNTPPAIERFTTELIDTNQVHFTINPEIQWNSEWSFNRFIYYPLTMNLWTDREKTQFQEWKERIDTAWEQEIPFFLRQVAKLTEEQQNQLREEQQILRAANPSIQPVPEPVAQPTPAPTPQPVPVPTTQQPVVQPQPIPTPVPTQHEQDIRDFLTTLETNHGIVVDTNTPIADILQALENEQTANRNNFPSLVANQALIDELQTVAASLSSTAINTSSLLIPAQAPQPSIQTTQAPATLPVPLSPHEQDLRNFLTTLEIDYGIVVDTNTPIADILQALENEQTANQNNFPSLMANQNLIDELHLLVLPPPPASLFNT